LLSPLGEPPPAALPPAVLPSATGATRAHTSRIGGEGAGRGQRRAREGACPSR
jgi:hypothetical protein